MTYHHFKGNNLSRSEKLQRRIIQLLLDADISDEKRESSLIWEAKHSSSCCQVGRILAEKRGLNVELAEIICVLHDIHVVMHGGYKNHAEKGAVLTQKLLKESEQFSAEEIELITEAVARHSEKGIYTDKPYVELAKDADVFDCSLYEGVESYYKENKSKHQFENYVKRIKKVRKELGLNPENVFRGT